ncbi:helix-turn-helix domain-containing protein [Marinovum sp.]|uniref:helix-turn-helix domain-containing protein n=1 Tax=Marinovum sp. TaxID=2024839 RepID=UPI002B274D87|nr:helix-turn-helix domain-containing protein [Marinovum sp.]
MERLFRLFLDESPATTYRNIRLDRAHSLLAETDMSVTEIAVACGFNDVSLLARHFKARFGETPYGKRGKK